MRHQSAGAHHSICRVVALVAAGIASATGATFADITPAGSAAENTAAIQSAIDAAANVSPAGTVTLGGGTFEIDAQLMVTGGVTLVGQGWENTIVKQTATGSDKRCATVDGGATIQRVTLTGGCINGNNSTGAGVSIKDGTVSWCCITNNTAGVTSGASVYGGGVGFYQGKGQVDHSIIAGNLVNSTTALGGGVGIYQPSGAITIDACLIVGNEATGKTSANGKGGGVYIDYMYRYADVAIRNCTIADNSASGTELGGGVCVTGDEQSNNTRTILTNDIMSGNTSASEENNVVISKTDKTSYCLFGLSAEGTGTTGSASGSPAFVDAANGDYHLNAGSPAIGKGTTYTGIGVDLDGVLFANPPAMGCYELSERASEPVFNPASGSSFYPTTSVALTSETAGATIHYTTDGSTPTESSTEYNGPIAISETTTIKARAYKTGIRSSAVAIANYICRPQPKNFKKSVEITLSTNLVATAITTGIPALVKLSGSTIRGFDYGDFSLSKGGDMMFVDERGTVLPHEVDTWNTAGESLVWVKLPSTAENTKIVLYYGNGTVSTAESTDVWTDYVGVWHFEEAAATSVANSQRTYANSTATAGIDGNVAQHAVVNETGRFGNCFRVNDSSGKQTGNYNDGGVWVNDSGTGSPIDGGQNFTISGWFKHGEFDYYWDHMFYKRVASNNTGSPNNAFAVECNSQGATPSPMARGSGNNGTAATLAGNLCGSWAYLTFVYEGNKCHVYENGVHKGDSNIAACKDNDSPLVFGNNVNIASGASGDCAWNGWIDEVRYASGSKSAAWIAAEYAAMNVGDTDIFTYGEAESTKARSGVIIFVE